MSSASFRRHTKLCVDRAIHRAVASLHRRHAVRDAFLRLVCVAQARSNLLRTPPTATGSFVQLDALRNLVRYEHAFVRDPYAWTGATGHPWCVVHALASHLLAPYAMPRFLASVWFGAAERREPRDWFIAHGHGQPFRRLALPIAMTRRMEHVFLRSPDHLSVEHALRRAEVIGVGGSPELAQAILATPLAATFDHGALWREVIEWLARCGDALELRHVGPIIDYLEHARQQPGFTLCGRTLDAMLRDVEVWQAARPRSASCVVWPPSRWRGFVYDIDDFKGRVRWSVVELVNSEQLAQEGRAMRHCVGTYARRCAHGGSTIWSLRRRDDDKQERPVLTVEVDPHTATIVQMRGLANQRATGWPLEVVRMWAAREGIVISASLSRS